MTLQQKLLSYYKENKEDFDHDIEELDEFNGYLCDNRCYHMEELDDLYDGFDPLTLLRLAFMVMMMMAQRWKRRLSLILTETISTSTVWVIL